MSKKRKRIEKYLKNIPSYLIKEVNGVYLVNASPASEKADSELREDIKKVLNECTNK